MTTTVTNNYFDVSFAFQHELSREDLKVRHGTSFTLEKNTTPLLPKATFDLVIYPHGDSLEKSNDTVTTIVIHTHGCTQVITGDVMVTMVWGKNDAEVKDSFTSSEPIVLRQKLKQLKDAKFLIVQAFLKIRVEVTFDDFPQPTMPTLTKMSPTSITFYSNEKDDPYSFTLDALSAITLGSRMLNNRFLTLNEANIKYFFNCCNNTSTRYLEKCFTAGSNHKEILDLMTLTGRQVYQIFQSLELYEHACEIVLNTIENLRFPQFLTDVISLLKYCFDNDVQPLSGILLTHFAEKLYQFPHVMNGLHNKFLTRAIDVLVLNEKAFPVIKPHVGFRSS